MTITIYIALSYIVASIIAILVALVAWMAVITIQQSKLKKIVLNNTLELMIEIRNGIFKDFNPRTEQDTQLWEYIYLKQNVLYELYETTKEQGYKFLESPFVKDKIGKIKPNAFSFFSPEFEKAVEDANRTAFSYFSSNMFKRYNNKKEFVRDLKNALLAAWRVNLELIYIAYCNDAKNHIPDATGTQQAINININNNNTPINNTTNNNTSVAGNNNVVAQDSDIADTSINT